MKYAIDSTWLITASKLVLKVFQMINYQDL